MKQNKQMIPTVCEACGGQIRRKNKSTFECVHCESKYYISNHQNVRIGINLSVKTMLTTMAGVILVSAVIGMILYGFYTKSLVNEASRFSVVFRDFLMNVYDKPIVDIDEEELEQIKYLCIEKKKAYQFTYSFEDYYDYEDGKDFEATKDSFSKSVKYDEFSPSNLQYFIGLTRVELYTDAWQNYKLPEENYIRSIVCNNGISKNGYSSFFENANPDTLEEVIVYEDEELKELYFLKDIRGVKKLTLERAVITDPGLFAEFTGLDELYLKYPIIKEDSTYEMIDGILQCENLKKLILEGRAQYYISEEEWKVLIEKYGDRVVIERK